jgi:hypothetical protein
LCLRTEGWRQFLFNVSFATIHRIDDANAKFKSPLSKLGGRYRIISEFNAKKHMSQVKPYFPLSHPTLSANACFCPSNEKGA